MVIGGLLVADEFNLRLRCVSGILQRKVDEISRLSETRRKEQERNFRLVSYYCNEAGGIIFIYSRPRPHEDDCKRKR